MKSQSANIKPFVEKMPTETDIYTKSTPADIEQSEENVLTDTAIHTESLLTDIEPSVENVPAETEIPESETSATKSPSTDNKIPGGTLPADSKIPENPSDVNCSISDSKLPFPDVSKNFYFREGRRWGRNETRNKERDATPVQTTEDG